MGDPESVAVLQEAVFEREGQSLNYDDPRIQRYYALRYMYAYGYEYLDMFRRLLAGQPLPSPINVLSIGCGYGIDYWALQQALAEREQSREEVNYTGVDLTDWQMKWGREPYLQNLRGSVQYHTEDAGQFLEENPILNCDVIVFPKSISEFPPQVFENISTALSKARFEYTQEGVRRPRGKVHILISLRKRDAVASDDVERSNQIIRSMESNGFVLEDPGAAEIYTVDAQEGSNHIRCVEPSFKYPSSVMAFMSREIGYMPTLDLKYICNRIMTFVRKEQE